MRVTQVWNLGRHELNTRDSWGELVNCRDEGGKERGETGPVSQGRNMYSEFIVLQI